MSLHLGLHWGMLLGMMKRVWKPEGDVKKGKIVFPVLGAVIALYGLTVFIRRDLLTYMLLHTQFVFLDFNEPVHLFIWTISQ